MKQLHISKTKTGQFSSPDQHHISHQDDTRFHADPVPSQNLLLWGESRPWTFSGPQLWLGSPHGVTRFYQMYPPSSVSPSSSSSSSASSPLSSTSFSSSSSHPTPLPKSPEYPATSSGKGRTHEEWFYVHAWQIIIKRKMPQHSVVLASQLWRWSVFVSMWIENLAPWSLGTYDGNFS